MSATWEKSARGNKNKQKEKVDKYINTLKKNCTSKQKRERERKAIITKNKEFPKVNNKEPNSLIAKWVKDTLFSKEEARCGGLGQGSNPADESGLPRSELRTALEGPGLGV